jgi:hypothetical protein
MVTNMAYNSAERNNKSEMEDRTAKKANQERHMHLPLSASAAAGLDTLSWPEGPAAGDAGAIASCTQQECRRRDLPEQNERRMETKGKGTGKKRTNVSALFRWRTLVTRLTVVIVVKGGGKGKKEKMGRRSSRPYRR